MAYFSKHTRSIPCEIDLRDRNYDHLIRIIKKRNNSHHTGTTAEVIETEWVVPVDVISVMKLRCVNEYFVDYSLTERRCVLVDQFCRWKGSLRVEKIMWFNVPSDE